MNRRHEIIAKILERVEMLPNKALGTPCWLWTGPTSGAGYKGQKKGRGHGYGRMSLDGQTVAVHIVMWVCHHGYLPGKKQLDHHCDNRNCCNPAHLEPVTHRRNQKRRVERAKLKRVPGRTDAFYDPAAMDQWTAQELAEINERQVAALEINKIG